MDNDINMNMTGKVVSVLIALLFIVVLAFPIANSLSDSGGNNDGGSGENGSDGILVNDVSELLSDMGVHIPDKYNSWVLYTNYEEIMSEGFGDDIIKFKPLENLDMSLDDLTELYEMNIGIDDYTNSTGFKTILCTNMDWDDYFDMGVWWYISDDTHEGVIDRYIIVGEYEISDLSMISEFHLTYDMETGLGNLNMVFDTGEGDVEINEVIPYAYVLSQEENGFISSEVVSYGANANDSMPISVNITNGVYASVGVYARSIQQMRGESTGIVGVNNGVLSDNGWFFDDMHLLSPSINGHQYEMTADVTITLTDGKIRMLYSPNVSFDEIRNVDDWTVSEGYSIISLLSTMSFSASDDSGDGSGSDSDSGSGIGGIAGTLVKLIPLLMIIGVLLIFVMPMINGKAQ